MSRTASRGKKAGATAPADAETSQPDPRATLALLRRARKLLDQVYQQHQDRLATGRDWQPTDIGLSIWERNPSVISIWIVKPTGGAS